MTSTGLSSVENGVNCFGLAAYREANGLDSLPVTDWFTGHPASGWIPGRETVPQDLWPVTRLPADNLVFAGSTF